MDRQSNSCSDLIKQKQDNNRDFEWAFSLNRICLKAIGVWPSEVDDTDTCSVIDNQLNHLRIPIMLFTMWFGLITPQLYALSKVYRVLQLVLDNLTLTYCTFTSFIKLFFLWRSSRVYGPILRSALIDWSDSRSSAWKYEIMHRQAYRAQIFTLAGYLVMTFSFVCFMFFPFFGLSIRIINNITDPGGEHRFLPIQTHYPFKYDSSPFFEIAYATQMIIGCCAASTFTIPDYFFGALVFHASAQCEILAAMIRELFIEKLDDFSTKKSKEPVIFRAMLRRIVRRHVHLIKFVNTIEKSFNMVILAQTFNLVLVICCLGFNIVRATKSDSDSLPILPVVTLGGSTITMMCHMLVYCFASEVLAMHSESIGTACYGCDWYLLSADCARNVIPIIARAQHPLQLSAGKFFYLSLNAFLSVVKTSFGYVSVLLAVGA